MATVKNLAEANPIATVLRHPTFPKDCKAPTLEIKTGADARRLRRKRSMNQLEFWSPLGVTQSGGSRYESGQNMPRATLLLLNLVYGGNNASSRLLSHLRDK